MERKSRCFFAFLSVFIGLIGPGLCQEAATQTYPSVRDFIRMQEISGNRVVQEYRLGGLYLTPVNFENQLKVIIDAGYLKSQAVDLSNKRLRVESAYEFQNRSTEELKIPPILFAGQRILSCDPVVYYIEDLGLQEGDKLKIMIAFEEKEENSDDWKTLSQDEVKFRLKKVGLKFYTHETLAFFRDSFSRNWKPQPGTSFTFGFTPYVTGRTRGLSRLVGRAWNFFDPRFGINLSLLDFDQDTSLEIGLGPVMALLKGTVYIGVGWNCTTSRRKNQYAFFGISLTEVTAILKSIIAK